jgi:GNAT superfamily N-acetyltransferase
MPDLLVNLQKLPALEPEIAALAEAGIRIRRARPFELSLVRTFIEKHFSRAWADEVSVGFANKPVTVYLATSGGSIIGFAAYECTARGFFGPEGVAEDFAGRGIGKALLLSCMWGLREMGYVYGIIGRAGPIEFYEKTVRAIPIPDSNPGFYVDLLTSTDPETN